MAPPEAYYSLTAMSERALAYSDEPMKHRMLVLFEATGLKSDMASYLVRSLLSEGRIRYETVESTESGLKPKLIEREGPTGLIITTTEINLHPENETRLLSLLVKDDRDQTKQIFLALAEKANGISTQMDLSQWHALQRWLELAGQREVHIPYARILAENTNSASVRMRRDFGLVLNLVRAHAILYQLQRDVDENGRIIARIEDYKAIYFLVNDLISEASEVTVTATVRETVVAVQDLLDEDNKEGVSLSELANHLKLDKSAASRRARKAIAHGYLSNLEGQRGKPARYVLGAEMPDDRPALPHPDLIIKKYLGDPPDEDATLQHSRDLSAVVKDDLDAPYDGPDVSLPCFACQQKAWVERPKSAGGGFYCGNCHPR